MWEKMSEIFVNNACIIEGSQLDYDSITAAVDCLFRPVLVRHPLQLIKSALREFRHGPARDACLSLQKNALGHTTPLLYKSLWWHIMIDVQYHRERYKPRILLKKSRRDGLLKINILWRRLYCNTCLDNGRVFVSMSKYLCPNRPIDAAQRGRCCVNIPATTDSCMPCYMLIEHTYLQHITAQASSLGKYALTSKLLFRKATMFSPAEFLFNGMRQAIRIMWILI